MISIRSAFSDILFNLTPKTAKMQFTLRKLEYIRDSGQHKNLRCPPVLRNQYLDGKEKPILLPRKEVLRHKNMQESPIPKQRPS